MERPDGLHAALARGGLEQLDAARRIGGDSEAPNIEEGEVVLGIETALRCRFGIPLRGGSIILLDAGAGRIEDAEAAARRCGPPLGGLAIGIDDGAWPARLAQREK